MKQIQLIAEDRTPLVLRNAVCPFCEVNKPCLAAVSMGVMGIGQNFNPQTRLGICEDCAKIVVQLFDENKPIPGQTDQKPDEDEVDAVPF